MALETNLVSYWKFDSDATDSVGTNDGTVTGATNTTGKIGNGYSFNGSSDYITTSSFDLTENSSFSISVWVKLNSITNRMIFVGAQDAPISNGGIYFGKPAGGGYEFRTYDGSSDGLYSTLGLSWSTDTWYHVVGTCDGSGTGVYKFYRNGILIATSGTVEIDTGSDALAIGSLISSGTTPGLYTDGVIDEVGLWNRALTAQEVSDLYSQGRGTTYDETGAEFVDGVSEEPLSINLVSYWKFDGDATDSVGSNDLTVNGATNNSSYGKINQGYYFDGLNDDLVDSDFSADVYSLQLWFNPFKSYNSTTTGNRMLFGIGSNNERVQIGSVSSLYPDELISLVGGLGLETDSWITTDLGISTIDASTWYHCVFVWNSAGYYELYLNGVNKGRATVSNIDSVISSDYLRFGNRSSTSEYWKGNIDETAIWSRALTSTEVSYLYASGSPTSAQQYPFTTPATGWTGKIVGVTNPSKINGIAVANISKVNGVE
jgi:hypothetical protein